MLLALMSLGLAQGSCPEPMRAPPNAPAECCWAAQVWDAQRGVCVGTPRCPEGLGPWQGDCIDEVLAKRAREIEQREAQRGAASGGPRATTELSGVTAEPVAAPLPEAPPPPGVSFPLGAREVTGGLDAALVDALLGLRDPAMEACYAAALAEDPALAGELTLGFVVGADGGHVRVTARSSTLGAPTLERCVMEEIEAVRFPRPEQGAAQATYLFVFVPG